jgi:hypothetical protein
LEKKKNLLFINYSTNKKPDSASKFSAPSQAELDGSIEAKVSIGGFAESKKCRAYGMAQTKNRTAQANLVQVLNRRFKKCRAYGMAQTKNRTAPTEWRKQKTGQRLRNGAFTRFLKVIKEK